MLYFGNIYYYWHTLSSQHLTQWFDWSRIPILDGIRISELYPILGLLITTICEPWSNTRTFDGAKPKVLHPPRSIRVFPVVLRRFVDHSHQYEHPRSLSIETQLECARIVKAKTCISPPYLLEVENQNDWAQGFTKGHRPEYSYRCWSSKNKTGEIAALVGPVDSGKELS
jgi:hypothetical protein